MVAKDCNIIFTSDRSLILCMFSFGIWFYILEQSFAMLQTWVWQKISITSWVNASNKKSSFSLLPLWVYIDNLTCLMNQLVQLYSCAQNAENLSIHHNADRNRYAAHHRFYFCNKGNQCKKNISLQFPIPTPLRLCRCLHSRIEILCLCFLCLVGFFVFLNQILGSL